MRTIVTGNMLSSGMLCGTDLEALTASIIGGDESLKIQEDIYLHISFIT
jgi:hypothetical protein